MKEQDQLTKVYNDLFEGTPWIDETIIGTLDSITAKEAATKPFPNFNSIWELVNHMINWRETMMKRLHGEEVESPEDNYFSYVRDRSEQAWSQTKNRFRLTQDDWVKTIKKMKRKEMAGTFSQSDYTRYDIVLGILEHDAYHLGQIRLLKKLVQLT